MSETTNAKVDSVREEIDDLRFWSREEIENAMGMQILSENFEHEFRTYKGFLGNNIF